MSPSGQNGAYSYCLPYGGRLNIRPIRGRYKAAPIYFGPKRPASDLGPNTGVLRRKGARRRRKRKAHGR